MKRGPTLSNNTIVAMFAKVPKKDTTECATSGRQGTGVFAGYYIYSTASLGNADNNCMFRAIAHQLNRPMSEGAQIRQELVQFLKENCATFPDLFTDSTWIASDVDELGHVSSNNLDSYIEHMSKESSYGDGIMLEMALAKYKRPILIVSDDFVTRNTCQGSILIANSQADLTKCMFLAFVGNNHYDSILPWPTIYTAVAAVPHSDAVKSVAVAETESLSESGTPLSSISSQNTMKPFVHTSSDSSQCSTAVGLSCNLDSEEVDNPPCSNESTAEVKEQVSKSPCNAWPNVWSYNIWKSWQSKQPWLICKDGQLGCEVCCTVGTTLSKKAGVQISKEWTESRITSDTCRKLKEKIYKHKDSLAHRAAVDILKMREQERLKAIVIDIDTRQFLETSRVFRTAYAISKLNMPFVAQSELLSLQEANGLNVGTVHRSNHSCAKIIAHISNQMKRNLCKHLTTLKPHVAVMLDESTVYGTSVIAVYLRTRLAELSEDSIALNYGVTNVFFGLLEAVEGCTAAGIMSAVDGEFEKFKLKDGLLLNNNSLIAICTDGASVMTGSSSGVATQFVDRYGIHVETFHCLAHRLELAVDDALKSVTATNHFQAMLKTLHALYSQSPKNQREIRQVAADIETELLRITPIFSIRWVASSFRAVRAVWRNYPALHGHFINASIDSSRSSTERAKFEGLAKKVSTLAFLKDLAIMKDVLRELSFLSLKLQSRTCNVVASYTEIATTVSVLKALKVAGGGKSTKKVLEAGSMHKFKQVDLTEGKPGINANQFMTAVVDCLSHRTETSSRLVEDLQKLYRVSWPPAHSEEIILFGEESVMRLAKRIGLPSRPVVEAYRKYKMHDGKPLPELMRLLAAAETYPGSTAECERGFSAMNEVVWDRRNALNISTISGTMFIKLNGVPVSDFDPRPYVQSWISAGNKESTSWKTGPKGSDKSSVLRSLVEKACM